MARRPWVDTADVRRSTSDRPGRDERRRAIVAAAIAAIEEDGPHALTGRIADRAGLARTHVYRHFASKEELDLAVARHAHHDLTERIRARLAVDGTPLDIIRAPLAQHVRWAAEHPNLYRFLVGRDYRRGRNEPRVGGSAFAAEISAAATRYLPEFGADPLAADRVVVALLGLVDASVRWWLAHHDTTESALVDRLTTECWLLIDNRLRDLGIAVDPRKPLPGN
ncbi:TetR/AcrR family transcriptional regulator [Nocardia araoensis]|uniref:TetR/AcrR family transcriptional regulator n=1 Tax=Nocardia araoensis TaxID=228600 RepID=UPI00058545B0|nr:TetR/AcrR family transcriptional regulator [Nocardia araoensis]